MHRPKPTNKISDLMTRIRDISLRVDPDQESVSDTGSDTSTETKTNTRPMRIKKIVEDSGYEASEDDVQVSKPKVRKVTEPRAKSNRAKKLVQQEADEAALIKSQMEKEEQYIEDYVDQIIDEYKNFSEEYEKLKKEKSINYKYALRKAKRLLLFRCASSNKIFRTKNIDDKFKIVSALENACYEATVMDAKDRNIMIHFDNQDFCSIYHSYCYRIASNIDQYGDVQNEYLIKLICDPNADMKKIVQLPSTHIMPDQYKDILQRMNLSKYSTIVVKTSTMYTCGRCKQKSCILENRQNRSLDEGISVIVTCTNCGFQFNAG